MFHTVILPDTTIWVGVSDDRVVAYLAMKGSYIDRLYVDPSDWRKSWGRRLIRFAKELSPDGLELHTHQENIAARLLYESEGFRVVKFGVSPPARIRAGCRVSLASRIMSRAPITIGQVLVFQNHTEAVEKRQVKTKDCFCTETRYKNSLFSCSSRGERI